MLRLRRKCESNTVSFVTSYYWYYKMVIMGISDLQIVKNSKIVKILVI